MKKCISLLLVLVSCLSVCMTATAATYDGDECISVETVGGFEPFSSAQTETLFHYDTMEQYLTNETIDLFNLVHGDTLTEVKNIGTVTSNYLYVYLEVYTKQQDSKSVLAYTDDSSTLGSYSVKDQYYSENVCYLASGVPTDKSLTYYPAGNGMYWIENSGIDEDVLLLTAGQSARFTLPDVEDAIFEMYVCLYDEKEDETWWRCYDLLRDDSEGNPEVNPFVDVQEGAYYYDAVLWAAGNNITAGIDPTHFGPNANVTRAQVVSFLWRAAGCPTPKGDASKFKDVKVGSYYEDAVAWAIEEGITSGTGATTFSPDASCTRGQIVTFLARFAGVPDAVTESTFTDVKSTDYYAAAVAWAAENGITSGVGNNQFAPKQACTRAQVVSFLYRFLG